MLGGRTWIHGHRKVETCFNVLGTGMADNSSCCAGSSCTRFSGPSVNAGGQHRRDCWILWGLVPGPFHSTAQLIRVFACWTRRSNWTAVTGRTCLPLQPLLVLSISSLPSSRGLSERDVIRRCSLLHAFILDDYYHMVHIRQNEGGWGRSSMRIMATLSTTSFLLPPARVVV